MAMRGGGCLGSCRLLRFREFYSRCPRRGAAQGFERSEKTICRHDGQRSLQLTFFKHFDDFDKALSFQFLDLGF